MTGMFLTGRRAGIIGLAAVTLVGCFSFPSHEQLRLRFERNSDDYELLRQWILRDAKKGVGAIALNGDSRLLDQRRLPAAELSLYKQKMAKARVQLLVNSGDAVKFQVAGAGLRYGIYGGIFWSPTLLEKMRLPSRSTSGTLCRSTVINLSRQKWYTYIDDCTPNSQ